MRRALPALIGAVVVVGLGVGAAGALSAGHKGASASFAAPPTVGTQYGHIRSLVRSGARYRMRFDPALWLSGATANRAAVEDGIIAQGEAVPNDYYIRDESPRQLTYLVGPGARVTVLTNAGGTIRSTRIAVSELARIVHGRNPNRRKLYGRDLGYWIRVAGDTVRSLDQQYQP
jgi:hypothetical protein